jgi:DnaK suppressor protein
MSAVRAQLRKPDTKIRTSRSCPRRRLQTSRNKLARRLEQLEAGLSSAPEIVGDDPDPSIQEKTKNFALAQHFEKQLETIDRALQAADRGEYGICARCGHPIATERLLVLPETRFCVHCKTSEEKSARGN